MARTFLFITIFITVLVISSVYIVLRLSKWSQPSPRALRNSWGLVGVFLLTLIAGLILYRMGFYQTPALYVFHYFMFTALGILACAFFYTLAMDLVLTFWQKVISSKGNQPNLERRSFLCVGALSFFSTAAGATQAGLGPQIYEVDIPIDNLPEQLDGFRIVQITDLHLGPLIDKQYTEKVVEMANDLKPDLVALTGDFVDGDVVQLQPSIVPLAQLKSTHGSFFVTGNHEYYWGAEEWIKEFRFLGIKVLLNEHNIISHNQHQIVLAGVTDHSAARILPKHKSSPNLALVGAPPSLLRILLAHQPASYKLAEKAGFDLQLSGHTHGGQFFPWSLAVKIFQPYYKGLNRHNRMWIYVSRGTGFWGPPIRFGVPSEITLIRLKRSSQNNKRGEEVN